VVSLCELGLLFFLLLVIWFDTVRVWNLLRFIVGGHCGCMKCMCSFHRPALSDAVGCQDLFFLLVGV